MPTYLILVIFLALSPHLFADTNSRCDEHSDKIRVATYNILNRTTWKSQRLQTYPPWQQRMTYIATWINQNNLDILGTQEGLIEKLDLLKKDLTQYEVVGQARSDDKNVGEYSALFINKKRYEVLKSGNFWLSKTPDVPGSRNWDSRYPRLCTWVELKDKKNNSKLFVFNTHYDHWGSYSRKQSTKIILDRVKKIAAHEKVIIMGDFNVEIGSSAIKSYLEYFLDTQDSSQSKPKGQPRSFFYGTIDHIFLSPQMVTCSYEIMEPKSSDHKQLSDHLPVVVEIAP